MTKKEIIAAYWQEIEGNEVLRGEAEALAREVQRGSGSSDLSDECVFIRRKHRAHLDQEIYLVRPASLPWLVDLIKKCHGFFDPKRRKEIRLVPGGVYVGSSFSDHAELEFALAEAMLIEWRKDVTN